ncbi:glycosyltransferase family 2 protein [Halomonas ventosae]|uniref:Glycosyltransferase 2-like domain-containing protein n=1 Tax=Halomonas ventosae TaxID=229007 RepID=A0A2T0VBE7_9GAMM|nr:glycosyltransferase family 2 protein [Halomonas ventosae]PRY67388.1 hypothetical protein BCL64_12128 [Halomonas ventosae]
MLDVVIVNWNAGVQLLECLNSVIAHEKGSVRQVIVVDNGSTDGSADDVDGLPGVKVIRTGKNLGFAAACNIGAAAGESPYILFLNPDTRVEPGSLSVPLAFMERRENAGVGICGIQLVDEQGDVSQTCARFPTLARLTISALGLDKFPGMRGGGLHMRDWGHDVSRKVDHVIGAFYVIRRKVFVELGGFDERFFVYLEDVDLSLRAQQAGYDSWYLTEARAFHAGGGTSRQVKARRLFFSLRSRLLYGFKHFPRWQAWCLVGVTGVLEPVTRTVWCLLRGDVAGVQHTWSAYRMLWSGMGRIMRGEGRFEP